MCEQCLADSWATKNFLAGRDVTGVDAAWDGIGGFDDCTTLRDGGRGRLHKRVGNNFYSQMCLRCSDAAAGQQE